MKIYSINTGYFKLDGGAMFGVVPKSIWKKTNPKVINRISACVLIIIAIIIALTQQYLVIIVCYCHLQNI